MQNGHKSNFDPNKFHNLNEIAAYLGVCSKTLRKKISPVLEIIKDSPRKSLYSPNDIEIIFEWLGVNKGKQDEAKK